MTYETVCRSCGAPTTVTDGNTGGAHLCAAPTFTCPACGSQRHAGSPCDSTASVLEPVYQAALARAQSDTVAVDRAAMERVQRTVYALAKAETYKTNVDDAVEDVLDAARALIRVWP